MAQYKVKLGSSDGEVIERIVHGASQSEVHGHYTNEGYFVFSVKPSIDFAAVFGLKGKIPMRKFIMFNREFRGLIKAGLPVVESLDILLKRMKAGKLRDLLEQVREQITKGASLSEAFASFGDMIPRYYPALLHAGEQSGNLVEVLERFIQQEERLRKTRKKFLQSLTYPALLIAAALVAIYIMMTRAMPHFASMYEHSDKELPAMTQVVVNISNWTTDYYGYLFGITFVAAITLFLFAQTEKGALLTEGILRRIPLLGTVWVLQNQNIFARTLRLLLSGGVPLTQALTATAGGVPSRLLGISLLKVRDEVSHGGNLQEALDTHTFFHDSVGEMIRVGEATGTIEEMLDYLAEHGEEQSEDYLEMVSSLVAPIVLLFVGLLIAFLVLSMYLPMFSSFELV